MKHQGRRVKILFPRSVRNRMSPAGYGCPCSLPARAALPLCHGLRPPCCRFVAVKADGTWPEAAFMLAVVIAVVVDYKFRLSLLGRDRVNLYRTWAAALILA